MANPTNKNLSANDKAREKQRQTETQTKTESQRGTSEARRQTSKGAYALNVNDKPAIF